MAVPNPQKRLRRDSNDPQTEVCDKNDQLQPSQEELEIATTQARNYWHGAAEDAMSHKISPRHFNLQDMLKKVPAIPERLGRIYAYPTGSNKKGMFIEASSSWHVSSHDDCGIDAKKRIIRTDVQIGTQEPTRYRLDGCCFCIWPQAGKQNATNYLGILVLGWSYVLSARLVEMQGRGGAAVSYTDSMAAGYSINAEDQYPPSTPIFVGHVDQAVARWWAAILAPHQGWIATVSRAGHETYQAPWAVFLDETPRLSIDWRKTESLIQHKIEANPPSSSKALGILADFSSQHNLGPQFSAALAAALLLPTHSFYGTIARLPFPKRIEDDRWDPSAKGAEVECGAISEELPYYMTLSCNPSVVMSSLCGTFWNPDISCNLVSPWLHPIIHEVPNGKGIANVPGRYHEILAFVGARRCPPLSALWLGAAASSLVPKILTFVESGTPPLTDNAFPWTGCQQSFMDTPGLGPYFTPNSSGRDITRADVWLLRFLPSVVDDDLYYECRPFTPWKPVGRTCRQNCDLRVRAHQDCQRHSLLYQHWNWKLEGGSTIMDQGYRGDATEEVRLGHSAKDKQLKNTIFPTLPLPAEQIASQNASRTILQWATVNGEGVPLEGVYQDEWVRDFLQDDDGSLSDSSDREATMSDVTNRSSSEWKATSGQPRKGVGS